MNKKLEEEMQFYLEKKTRKKKMNWVIICNSSILLEIFSFVSKCLSCNREKTHEMR